MALILIVEDEKLLRWALEQQLQRAGHTVVSAPDLAAAAAQLETHQPDVVLLDLGLPDGHGLDFYENNRERLDGSVVIVMTALGAVEEAVRAMKLGALDFLTKPVNQADLVALVGRSLAVRGDQLEARAARQVRERSLAMEIVGVSPAFLEVKRVVEDVAGSEVASVLIQGESGSGKNVLARYLHARSRRRARPILEVSCAAIPDTLLESELFGHEKGAFTDARSQKLGTIELGDGGTVVLDEVAELRLVVQAKLLHFLEERRFRRVGGTREIQADVRIVALTNRDLPQMVRDGRFRNDLFFRLSVFPITAPPLRQRPEDILALASHYLLSLQYRFTRQFAGFTREAENLLLAYGWPGNARELRNVVERAMVLERDSRIGPRSLLLDFASAATGNGTAAPAVAGGGLPAGVVPLEEMEREMVTRALRATGQNQTRAAELLGISRDQLRHRIKRFGLGEDDAGDPA
jgi:DNA-binding NtrC family response regulator